MEEKKKPTDIASFIVRRPWSVATVAFVIQVVTFIPGLPLKKMQMRLKLAARDAMLDDFSKRAVEPHEAFYLLWCKGCSLAGHHEYMEDQGRALRVLEKVKSREHACRDIKWGTPESPLKGTSSEDYWGGSGSVSKIVVDLGRTPDKCAHFLGGYLRGIRGQDSGDVRAGLASAIAVLEASSEENERETMLHESILLPVLFILLYNVVGGGFRAIVPIVMSMWAAGSTSVILIILKRVYPELELGFISPVAFVTLAFSVDYGIFFWTRFDQERVESPAKEDYLECVAQALRKTAEVIICSTVIMSAVYGAICVYPGMNAQGWLAMHIQLSSAMLWCCLYNLTAMPSWAAALPSLYDNREPGALLCFTACLPIALTNLPDSKKFWRMWAGHVTRGKTMFVIPFVVYCSMIPFLSALWKYKPNYNTLDLGMIDDLPETDAYAKMMDVFGAGSSTKFTFVIKVHELGAAHNEKTQQLTAHLSQTPEEVAFAQHAIKMSRKTHVQAKVGHGIVMEAEVGVQVCKFSEQLLSILKRNFYNVDSKQIQNVWFGADPFGNNVAGCRSQDDLTAELHRKEATFTDLFDDQVTSDGQKLMLVLYPGVDSMGRQAQSLYHLMRDTFEPQAAHEFEMNGKRYWFNAKHTSPVSYLKENGAAMHHVAPLVMGVTLVVSFVGVAWMYTALLLPFKFFLTVILPVASVFGAAVALFQLDWFSDLGCHNLANDGGISYNIVYCIGMVFGLAMDYDLFLYARVHEYRLEGYDNISSVQRAVTETGPIITTAGCFMLLAFFCIMISRMKSMSQIGFMYFCGVLLDTFVVRTCIAPSILCWGEVANFWPGAIPPATKTYCECN